MLKKTLRFATEREFYDAVIFPDLVAIEHDTPISVGSPLTLEIYMCGAIATVIEGTVAGPLEHSNGKSVLTASIDEVVRQRCKDSMAMWIENDTALGGLSNEIILGIDLGTTNTLAAVLHQGTLKVVPFAGGRRYLPSLVAFASDWTSLVGEAARPIIEQSPTRGIYGSKRLIGKLLANVSQETQAHFTYGLSANQRGEVAAHIDNVQFELPWVAAMLLRETKAAAEVFIGSKVTKAVVSVPAYFNENQRHAVLQAGSIAGLTILKIINEPTAAILSYRRPRDYHKPQHVLVYDLGGGTFDVSLVELFGHTYEVLATGGDTFLGGDDFDQRIAVHLIRAAGKKLGITLETTPTLLLRARKAAEKAKRELSEKLTARIPLIELYPEIDAARANEELVLSREILEGLIHDLVAKTVDICEQTLLSKGMTVEDIDEILLVGGQTYTPYIQEYVAQELRAPIKRALHPEEAVAMGAAYYAATMSRFDGIVLLDVLSVPIGVGLSSGGFMPILDQNSSLPLRKSFRLARRKGESAELSLKLYQGEHEQAVRNEFLGAVTIDNSVSSAEACQEIVVEFSLTEDGILRVAAHDASTLQPVETNFRVKDTSVAITYKDAAQATLH